MSDDDILLLLGCLLFVSLLKLAKVCREALYGGRDRHSRNPED